MRLESKTILEDVRLAASNIQEFIADISFEDYSSDDGIIPDTDGFSHGSRMHSATDECRHQ